MPALKTDDVLREEARELLSRRRSPNSAQVTDKDRGRELFRKLYNCKFSALCLSGGGIRSASFALGIIQALAAHPKNAQKCLLAQFDYLSTVSGGGYIGSWLSVWCKRAGFQKVWKALVSRPDAPDIEPREVEWLRSYSNYLNPRVGLMSPDAWTAAANYLCNLLLNWLIILPVICCAILALKLLLVWSDSLIVFPSGWLQSFPGFALHASQPGCLINWQPYAVFCGLPGLILLLWSMAFIVRYRVLRGESVSPGEKATTQRSFISSALVPSVLSAILLAQLFGSDPFSGMFEKLGNLGCDPVGGVEGVGVAGLESVAASIRPQSTESAVDDHQVVASSASAAGIESGDLIKQFGPDKIETSGDLRCALRKAPRNSDISVIISRDSERMDRTVRLTDDTKEYREPRRCANESKSPSHIDLLGISIRDDDVLKSWIVVLCIIAAVSIGALLLWLGAPGWAVWGISALLFAATVVSGPYFLIPKGDSGVPVSRVLTTSELEKLGLSVNGSTEAPAKLAGIEPGDVITKFGDKEVKTPGDLTCALKKSPPEVPTSITISRGGETSEKPVKLQDYNGTVFNPSEYLIGGECVSERSIIAQFGITTESPDVLEPRWGKRFLLVVGSICGAILFGFSFLVGWIVNPGRIDIRSLSAWLASGAVFGLLVSSAFYLFITTAGGSSATAMFLDSPAFPLTVGVPWILGSQLLSYFVFVGLSSNRAQSDVDREWLGRAGGWLLVAIIGWFAISLLTFGGLFLLLTSDYMTALREFIYGAIGPITAVSGFVTAMLGKSNITGRLLGSGERAYLPKVANVALAIAAPVFLAAFIFVLSIALDKLILGQLLFEQFSMSSEGAIDKGMSQTWKTAWTQFVRPILFGLVCSAALGFAASYWVNINRFSMHSFYRNRLIRAFLGASGDRKQDPFTRFSADDNMPMHELWPAKASDWQPFHIINITLNLLSGKRLAWQERKAAPFSVSPLHCGTPSVFETSAAAGVDGERPCGAYRPAKEYGHKISVGTAMAISGAAVSPNMGYHSAPAMTLLMSMFNVRLGWWLGNTAIDRGEPYKDEGPRWAAVPLFQETFGMTTDERKYVYLSDGGHFENLGLYEMVRRRCCFILVVDAGYDPEFSFEDLGNAVRKIGIDLGVPIKFHGIKKLQKRSKEGASTSGSKQAASGDEDHVYHAIGEIDYGYADGAIEHGIILYVKPSYLGCEDITVRSYAEAHDDFPHEGTVDQWFSESQFESYRALGFEIMTHVLAKITPDPENKGVSLQSMFDAIEKSLTAKTNGLPAGPTAAPAIS